MVDESVLERIIINRDEKPTDLPLALLQHITNDFSEERKIGHGGFGAVYKGVLRKGFVAVKRIYVNIDKIDLDDKLFRYEFNSLWKTNHQNVVRCLGFCSNTHMIPIEKAGSKETVLANVRERLFCLEYIDNGSLDQHITDELRGLEWERRYEIIIGICKGLCYLHEEKNIVHMDLKPANILLHGKYMVPKITDFGLSRPDEKSHTMAQPIGTRGYIAPEYEKSRKTSTKCDIYSLGAIIYELITGCMDTPDKNYVHRRWRHRWNKPPTLIQYKQVTRCIEIAVRCRKQEPEDRPSICDMIRFLRKSEESTDERTCMENTFLDDMLGIEPLELRFAFKLNKKMSCSVKLTNKTKFSFAFNIESPSKKYTIRPEKGIVHAGCNAYFVHITVQLDVCVPQATQNADKFIVRSRKVDEGIIIEDNTEHMFRPEAGKLVDEVYLVVVYECTKPQENRKIREGTNMPVEEVPEEKNRRIVGSSYEDIDSSNLGHFIKKTKINKFYPPRSFSHHYPTNITYLGKGSRAVDVTRGAMGSLLDKLGKLMREDYNLESSMKRHIESFAEDLANIHKDLPNLGKLDGVEIWVDEVRELSYNIEDMVDSFVVCVEHDSSGSGFRELPHEGLKFFENDMTTDHRVGDVITNIKNQVQAMVDRQKKYNFNVYNIRANATAKAPIDPRMGIYINKEQLIGIEARTNDLIRLFEGDGNVLKKELKIVSIVGLGGLGKTTLAKALYDKLKAQYQYRIFVLLGQNPDMKKFLMHILSTFGIKFRTSNLEVWQLNDKLEEFLKEKRYFIVVDDIWDSEAWGIISSAFPRNNHGSKVITTTRNELVARACCEPKSKYVYRMKPLSEEESRSLFLRRIFGTGKDCPDAKKRISTDILKRCSGMPLAINSIASLLAGDESGSNWEYVWKSLGGLTKGDDVKNMKKILDLSYIYLPDHLKTCLVHVCIYPEDQEIDKNDLTRQWVSEGFVVSTNGRLDAEDVAETYFKELINMCMIQPERIDEYSNEVMSCTVHDIIVDLMRSKSSEENFNHVIDGSKAKTSAHREIRRISVHGNEEVDNSVLETINEPLLHVRSAILYNVSPVPYLLAFMYIRVLHIGCTCNIDLTGITRLFMLRYLKIKSSGKLKLPGQLGELQQLETIDFGEASFETHPYDIGSLPWLSHLMYDTRSDSRVWLPEGVERLKLLRTLEGVHLYESSAENIKGIGKLTRLRKLQVFLEDFMLYDEETTSEEGTTAMRMNDLHSSISMLSATLRILTLGVEGDGYYRHLNSILDVPRRWSSKALFHEGSAIVELDLGCCRFERCPGWISQLHNLQKFSVMVREVGDGLTMVAWLPSLSYLFFQIRCDLPKEEKKESVVIPGTGSGAFKALRKLIFYCPKAALTFEPGAMPKLEKLGLQFPYIKTPQLLPVGIQHLPAPAQTDLFIT